MELLQNAFIFLAAGVIAVPIASRLGLGSVLGYLMAGALIGPYVLGLVKQPEDVMHFAEFGVVIMLFLIGLELKPSILWRMRMPILGLGGLQVVVTTLALTTVAWLVGQDGRAALAIGLILALSSTAIALQIFEEKQLLQTDGGRSAFAVLLFQDIAVIPILALLPLLATRIVHQAAGDEHNVSAISHLAGWQQTLLVIAVVAGIILVGRFLTRPIFRFIAESHLREIFTAAALLLVVGITLLMNMVGLSPALGAFIAGVVLADNEYRHELEANIEPFKGLLLGLFFISVGAEIDFNLLLQKPMLIGGIVLGLIVIKGLVLWLLATLFQIRGGDSYWFAFGLAQGGEFGFVLLTFAQNNYVLNTEIVNLLTVAIASSMLLTPILILLNEKWVQPLFHDSEQFDDAMTDNTAAPVDSETAPVILAGFGRFGQIVGRLLLVNDIKVTVLDNSAAHIERVRRFGFQVFYGDAGREDLLRLAGAEKAKLLVIAVDDREKTLAVLKTVKRSFPNLQVLTRAYDVLHYHDLQRAGADYIEREMFQGALTLGEQTLRRLGMRAFQARRNALQFALHDREIVAKLAKDHIESKSFISAARQAHQEVLETLHADRQHQQQLDDHAWDVAKRD